MKSRYKITLSILIKLLLQKFTKWTWFIVYSIAFIAYFGFKNDKLTIYAWFASLRISFHTFLGMIAKWEEEEAFLFLASCIFQRFQTFRFWTFICNDILDSTLFHRKNIKSSLVKKRQVWKERRIEKKNHTTFRFDTYFYDMANHIEGGVAQ